MIELILREDVPALGRAGQLVRVKPGYARNFLLPRGLAFEATDGNRRRIAAEARSRDARAATEREEAAAIATRLAELTVELRAKAGDDGRLFGSITATDLADALAERGITVDKRRLELEHPIKHTGLHVVPLRLSHDVHAEVRVNVVAQDSVG